MTLVTTTTILLWGWTAARSSQYVTQYSCAKTQVFRASDRKCYLLQGE
ncbi:MAG: hypothetical protein HC780_16270 [Leptolyngbyaceae cyanobacterium CSU_1_3]|nr:hypothetical protein [Leptolyngbyaceae cyanobacterium CSU_1_3]